MVKIPNAAGSMIEEGTGFVDPKKDLNFFGLYGNSGHFQILWFPQRPYFPVKSDMMDCGEVMYFFLRRLLIMMSQVRALQGEPEKALKQADFPWF